MRITVDGENVTSYVRTIEPVDRKMGSVPFWSFELYDAKSAKYSEYINGEDGTQWKDAQFKDVSLYDETKAVYLFVGRISNIIFSNDRVQIRCVGISSRMKDKTIPNSLSNFIYAEGLISDSSYGDAETLRLTDNDGDPLTMTDDEYINKGILIDDKTDKVELSWDASSISDTWTSSSGTPAYTHTKDDASYYIGSQLYDYDDGDVHYGTETITINMDGVDIPNTYDITKLTIKFAYTAKQYVEDEYILYSFTEGNWRLQIYNYNTSSYDNLPADETLVTIKWNDDDGEEGDTIQKKKQGTITLGGNIAERYLNDNGSDYNQVKLRLITTYQILRTKCYYYALIDYLNVEVEYQTNTFSSIQKQITDNGADWIESSGEDFEALGVTIDDSFQIGELSSVILSTIFDFINVDLDVDTTFSKYIARNFKGRTPMEVLESVCIVEDAYWWEEYSLNGDVTIYVRTRGNWDIRYSETIDFDNNTVGEAPTDGLGTWTVVSGAPIVSSGYLTQTKPLVFTGATNDSIYYDTVVSTTDIDYKVAFDTSKMQDNGSIVMDLKDINDIGIVTMFYTYSDVTTRATLDIYMNNETDYLGAVQLSGNEWNTINVVKNEASGYYEVGVNGTGIYSGAYDSEEWRRIEIYNQYQDNYDHKYYIDDIVLTGIDVSSSHYDWDFTIERESNTYSAVRVLGNVLNGIDVTVTDITVDSPREKLITDQTINTESDAYEIANNELNRLSSIRPSIELNVNSGYELYTPGREYNLSLSDPTITGAFPVRRITNTVDFPNGLRRTKVYFGLGQTPPQEKLANTIKRNRQEVKNAHLNALNPQTIVNTLSYNDLTNKPGFINNFVNEGIVNVTDGSIPDDGTLVVASDDVYNEFQTYSGFIANNTSDINTLSGVVSGNVVNYTTLSGVVNTISGDHLDLSGTRSMKGNLDMDTNKIYTNEIEWNGSYTHRGQAGFVYTLEGLGLLAHQLSGYTTEITIADSDADSAILGVSNDTLSTTIGVGYNNGLTYIGSTQDILLQANNVDTLPETVIISYDGAPVIQTSGTTDLKIYVEDGDLDVSGAVIKNVSDPSNAQDAATKNYVDNRFISGLTTGVTISGTTLTFVSGLLTNIS